MTQSEPIKAFTFVAFAIAACFSSIIGCRPESIVVIEGETHSQATSNDGNEPQIAASKQDAGELKILFIGNSHTSNQNVPDLVKQFFAAVNANLLISTQLISTPFLENLAGNRIATRTIEEGDWDVVILQGQKISMSGKYLYSTDEAKQLSRVAHNAGARVILFSEWGRKGFEGESERTQAIYEEIQSANDDALAPVGRVWDAAMKERPELILHASDGNHANFEGAWLTALTLFYCITGNDCREIPNIPSKRIDENRQQFFKQTAWLAAKDFILQGNRQESDEPN